jgi:hypothetical protein
VISGAAISRYRRRQRLLPVSGNFCSADLLPVLSQDRPLTVGSCEVVFYIQMAEITSFLPSGGSSDSS